MCEICSKLTVKEADRRHWRRSVVFIFDFEQISHIVLVFPFVDFEQANAGWGSTSCRCF